MNAPAQRDPFTWRPHAAQELALRSAAYELLFGGAAGGGKTDFLKVAPLRWVKEPGFRAILFRRSYPELERTLITASRALYPALGAVYHEARHVWTFPSGATIAFGYCEKEKDVLRYQGAEYSFLGIDELTHFSEAQYRYLTSRARSADGLPIRIRATSNPGGPGHEWVRARFGAWVGKAADAAPGELCYYDADGRRVPEGTPWSLSRTFVPAKLADNPYLGTDYRAQLLALDPVTRAQLLDGDWDATIGEGKLFHRDWWQYFDTLPPDVEASARAWDFGGTADGDPTRGLRLRRRPRGVIPRYVIDDLVTLRGAPHEVHALVKSTALLDGPGVVVVIPQDPGQAGIDQAQSYKRDLEGFTVHSRRPSVNKVTRAGPASSQVGARNFALVRGPWNAALVAEGHAFPDGPHDDIIDALSDAFAELTDGGPADVTGWLDDFMQLGVGVRRGSRGARSDEREALLDEDEGGGGWGLRRE